MVLSDVILVLRTANKIASFAAEEYGRSVAQHLRTSSLVPRQVRILAAKTSEQQQQQPPPSTKLVSQLAARGVPIMLHPGRLDRRHLLRVFEHKQSGGVGQGGYAEIRTETAVAAAAAPMADLPDLGQHVPLPPVEPTVESAQPTTGHSESVAVSIEPVTETLPTTDQAEPARMTAAEQQQRLVEYEAGEDDVPQKQQLRASAMPSNRVSRLYHYGSLAVGLGWGALGEATKRWSGFSDSSSDSSVILNRANIDRIVDKLSKMRGAALKLGQMLSIQDSKSMTPEVSEVLQRVQNSANYMPIRQLERLMRRQLGADWRDAFVEFHDEPFAAASIGQVHRAQIEPARHGFDRVAVKVQYPGVAGSIESDLSNLQSLLVMSKLLPRGMYLENTIKVARKELEWECDYAREADAICKFGELLAGDSDFAVPRLVPELSNKMVLTTEFMDGMDMNRVESLSQEVRDHVGTSVLKLCLRELFEFEFMQTDPNWANFMYNAETGKIVLLDFGASRGFGKAFLDKYLNTLKAAMEGDRDGVRHWSTELGFLTGYEADVMTNAHVDSVLEIGKPFRSAGLYDFGSQDVSNNVREAIPVMLRHRLTPPPDETYSLHRKLSGAYLLCIKLRSRVPCQELFKSITSQYTFSDGSSVSY